MEFISGTTLGDLAPDPDFQMEMLKEGKMWVPFKSMTENCSQTESTHDEGQGSMVFANSDTEQWKEQQLRPRSVY